jgi:ligand-binding sensor protein
VIEECDAGLIKLVVPIIVKEEYVGSIGACGLLLEDGEVDSFMVNRTIGIDEEEVDALSNDIGKISMSDIQALAADIQKKVDRIVEKYNAGMS